LAGRPLAGPSETAPSGPGRHDGADRRGRWAAVLALSAILLVPARLTAAPLTYDVRGVFGDGELGGAAIEVSFTWDTDAVEPVIDGAQAAPADAVAIRVPGVLDVTTADFDVVERSRLGTFADRFFFLEFGGRVDQVTLGLGLGLSFGEPVDLRAPLPLGTLETTELFLNLFTPEGRLSGSADPGVPLSITLREPAAVPGPSAAVLLVAGGVGHAVLRRRSRVRPPDIGRQAG
jgi:hypothetical protein